MLTESIRHRFQEWAQIYGPVFSLKLGPSTMIVLCDRKAVHDLVDKKGSIYSDRPKNTVAQIVTKGHSFAFMDGTPKWRAQRKVVAHNFSVRPQLHLQVEMPRPFDVR